MVGSVWFIGGRNIMGGIGGGVEEGIGKGIEGGGGGITR